MFDIKRYEASDKLEWNQFVTSAKNATFLFYRDFMDYHSDRFTDHSLLIFKNNKLVAIFIGNETNNIIYSHAGLTYGGLVVQNELYSTDFFKIFKSVLSYYQKHGFLEVNVKTIPHIFTNQPADEIDYLAFICQANLYRRDVHSAIYFNNPYRISKSVFRDYKSVKNTFIFKESNDFNLFWNTLLIPNLLESHQSLPVHSLDEMIDLKNKFPNQIKLFGCYLDELLLGGVVIFETQNVAHCQYISGTKTFNKLHGLSFLLYNLLEYYSDKKTYFNFGISNINNGKNINEGLILWKEKFGARSVSQSFYSFKTQSYSLIDLILV